MAEHILNVRIVQPGRASAQYRAVDYETLQLEKVIFPAEPLPFDIGCLPVTLTPFGDPLTVIVLDDLSHPQNTQMEARLLGALKNDSFLFPVVVPTANEKRDSFDLNSLPESVRAEIVEILSKAHPGKWDWISIPETEPYLHAATLRHRQAKEAGGEFRMGPAWRPVHIKRLSPSFDSTERYTAAEYTFYELPAHFKHYVQDHLAPDERILYAVPRPSMRSFQKRSWLERSTLQAGVLILTDQRLIQLAELMPPDNANIRYGYHSTLSILERFAGATLQTTGGDNLLLCSSWSAKGGVRSVEWEAAAETRTEMQELVSYLQAFRADDPTTHALRRSSPPPVPQPLPTLRDSAANEPETLVPINERFSAAVTAVLSSGEEVHAWALFPDWFTPGKRGRVLVVTDRRIFTVPDLSFDVPLASVVTLAYASSILESFLIVDYFTGSKLCQIKLPFPYPAEGAFHECLEAARRCMAVVPLT